ncbi:MAG: hypothetical protein KA004_07450, partial [Verrucomicrobiales bacterium]|nr:hypothetical protein [Verrucomicrobiales bacterium]
LRSAAEDLKLAPSAVLGGYQRLELQLGVTGLLPSYSVDAPPSTGIGSSEETKSAAELLEIHGVGMSAIAFNRLLMEHGIETAGASVVIVGRSMIVGKPLALLLMARGRGGDATVTVAHSRTRNLAAVCREADILISAIGRPRFVTQDFVKEGAVVVDVGINRIADPATKSGYRIVGDVDFETVAPKCRAITPVPGGVGPMTIAMLMQNTIKACSARG